MHATVALAGALATLLSWRYRQRSPSEMVWLRAGGRRDPDLATGIPVLRHASLLALLALLVLTALLAFASPAAAATCADHPNQAAAQRAADTRDPDGDGLYCESLPCPCLAPGAGGQPPTPRGSCPPPDRLPFERR